MVETSRASRFDAVALEYAEDEKLLVPANELDQIWRYGAADAVVLDRLGSNAWSKRRARLETEIAQTAQRLLAKVRERDSMSAPRIEPPRLEYERFVSRFPFSETPDQLQAIADTLNDLASGKHMDRLVCGDVGFGKTEVALRAAAAAAFAGKQVAVIAPTTVLVKQHVQTFQQRFAGFGVRVAAISRLVKPSEASEVKDRLARGDVRIVIGTHALLGRGIAFKNLGLLVIDEEHRFGAAQKAKLRKLAVCVHTLTLTATPIPRTLQAALVGLQQMSVIATPPTERRAIRTLLIPFEEAAVREALMREHRRGGQSFVVCPRIEDIAPMETRLTRLVPSLDILVAHGKMSAEDIDRAMLRFANGRGDVLLATNIIESGLDLPSANTMLVWRADRFGLAQLHQLRGRVGRGRVRGIVYLLTDPEIKLARVTRKRLETIEGHYHLGSGFAISSHDLDLRGAGDLLGEDQAGHIKLIGAELYRWLLDRALRAARGNPPLEAWSPELNLGLTGWIPADYVPEQDLRIEIYARLARLLKVEEMEALRDEVEDRFGPIPKSLRQLFVLARLKAECRQARIARIDAGPLGIALAFQATELRQEELERLVRRSKGMLSWVNERLVSQRATNSKTERQRLIMRLVARLASISSDPCNKLVIPCLAARTKARIASAGEA
jgi:transcription-repair coupling factor (superfamily II helicase)